MPRILTVTLNPALDIATVTAELRPDEKLRCTAPHFDPGGGGVNVSRAVAFLGGESRLLVALGGNAGAHMRALLDAEGLAATDLGVTVATRRSVTVLEQASGRQYRFVLPGPEWTPDDCATAAGRIAETVAKGDFLVVSGSLPPGVPEDFFLRLNDELAPRGVRMILDTSGGALKAAAAAPGAPLAVLRMDREEAEALAGRALAGLGDLADLAGELVARGAAGIVAVASGADGTVVATAEGRWHCRPPVVEVVSKVGAGDSFVAGFTLALAGGAGAAEACRDGVAAAASAVTTPDTRLCEKEGAERYCALVETTPL